MLLPAPPLHVRKRSSHRKRKAPQPAPSGAPVLIAATYDSGTSIELTFDRPINASGLIPDEVILIDGPLTLMRYSGDGAAGVISPTKILIGLTEVVPSPGPQVLLTINDGNGIVAVDGGVPWTGVADLVLPFP